jgi:hypothetical protein
MAMVVPMDCMAAMMSTSSTEALLALYCSFHRVIIVVAAVMAVKTSIIGLDCTHLMNCKLTVGN